MLKNVSLTALALSALLLGTSELSAANWQSGDYVGSFRNVHFVCINITRERSRNPATPDNIRLHMRMRIPRGQPRNWRDDEYFSFTPADYVRGSQPDNFTDGKFANDTSIGTEAASFEFSGMIPITNGDRIPREVEQFALLQGSIGAHYINAFQFRNSTPVPNSLGEPLPGNPPLDLPCILQYLNE